MLNLYHTPFTSQCDHLWIVLLEESIPLELDPEAAHGSTGTLTQHPFQRGPILIDDDFIVVESPDTLNYLKAPGQAPVSIALHRLSRVRAMDMVPLRKLVDIVMPRFRHQLSCYDGSTPQQTSAKQQALTILSFFEELLHAWPSFGEVRMILAEVVLGTMDCLIPPLLNRELPSFGLNPNLLTSVRTCLWQSV